MHFWRERHEDKGNPLMTHEKAKTFKKIGFSEYEISVDGGDISHGKKRINS